MATVAAIPDTEHGVAPAVRTCYDVLDVARACGITDFTDGKYIDARNDRAAYLAAQERQAEYLLDQARCEAGSRLLDIGCGYGRILEQASRRGARPIGITISKPQVAANRSRGLEVRELNYRDIFLRRNDAWAGAFAAVIANGSLEHFVQAADAAAGRADDIYAELFEICRRLLMDDGRFVTTAIHFREVGQFEAREIVRGPQSHPRGSANYQLAMLSKWFGGWYPEPGQLERCAGCHFELVDEEDGTCDYCLTSEYWLKQLQFSLAFHPRVWWRTAQELALHPRAAFEMLRLHLWDQSWCWQFRDPAPMRLLRQTWLCK